MENTLRNFAVTVEDIENDIVEINMSDPLNGRIDSVGADGGSIIYSYTPISLIESTRNTSTSTNSENTNNIMKKKRKNNKSS